MKEYIFHLPEGIAKVSLPKNLSPGSSKDIEDWLTLILRAYAPKGIPRARHTGKAYFDSVYPMPIPIPKPDNLSGTIFGCKHCGHKLMAERWRSLTNINGMCPKCNTEQVSDFKVISCPAKLTTNKVPRETG